MLMSSYKSVTTPEMLVRLWCHESKRVFEDRLINAEDHAWFINLLKRIVTNSFNMDWDTVVPQVYEMARGIQPVGTALALFEIPCTTAVYGRPVDCPYLFTVSFHTLRVVVIPRPCGFSR